jgi:lysyl-tRNA synthetase class 2
MSAAPGRPAAAWPAASALLSRYARLRDNPRLRRTLTIRSRVGDALRRTLHERGFLEVDTPLLQRDRTRRPFPVGSAALGDRLYLRSSPLYLRGMLAAGFPQVFEVARMFRDEPVDATHQPEYTLVEIYQAGADAQQMLALARHLLITAATAALDTTAVRVGADQLVDLAGPWPARSFYDALSHATGTRLDPDSTGAQLTAAADQHAVTLTTTAPADRAIELHDRLVQPATATLAVYTHFPAAASPLARPADHDPRLAQKWDLVIAGVEIATGYTEQHDAPAAAGSVSGENRLLSDEWAAVFTGMPPSGGLCLGLDRLVALLVGAPDIAETIAFPLDPGPQTP